MLPRKDGNVTLSFCNPLTQTAFLSGLPASFFFFFWYSCFLQVCTHIMKKQPRICSRKIQISSIRKNLPWFPISFRVKDKTLPVIFKAAWPALFSSATSALLYVSPHSRTTLHLLLALHWQASSPSPSSCSLGSFGLEIFLHHNLVILLPRHCPLSISLLQYLPP